MIGFSFYGVKKPSISILINKKLVYKNIIDGSLNISLPIEISENTTVDLIVIAKHHSEGRIHNTIKDEQDRILEDKFLTINDIVIDQISMGTEWIKSINTIENNKINSIYNSGKISFTINVPVLDWIIDEKYIKQQSNLTSNNSYSGLGKFDYSYINDKIAYIKKLLND